VRCVGWKPRSTVACVLLRIKATIRGWRASCTLCVVWATTWSKSTSRPDFIIQELVKVEVAVATSRRHAALSRVRRFAVARPRFSGRRSGRPVLGYGKSVVLYITVTGALHPVQSDSRPVVDVVLAGSQRRAGACRSRYHDSPHSHHSHLQHQRLSTKGRRLRTVVTLKP